MKWHLKLDVVSPAGYKMLPQSPTPKHLEWVRGIARCHHEALSRYAFGICRNRERAQDAVQETYVRLLKQDRRKIESHVKPWLLRVCRSRILDLARKEGRMTILDYHNGSQAIWTTSPGPAGGES